MAAPLLDSLPAVLADARRARGMSVTALAERSGVSRAMIAKVERGEAQPTAALLARLSGALGMRLSELLAHAEAGGGRVGRASEHPVWRDPETGYRRRVLSPATGGPLELIEVELPPGAAVSYPAEAYSFIHQQVWVISGELTITEGGVVTDLRSGDCIEFGAPSPCTLANTSRRSCRYLVALTTRAR